MILQLETIKPRISTQEYIIVLSMPIENVDAAKDFIGNINSFYYVEKLSNNDDKKVKDVVGVKENKYRVSLLSRIHGMLGDKKESFKDSLKIKSLGSLSDRQLEYVLDYLMNYEPSDARY